MNERKPYPQIEDKDGGILTAGEHAAALADYETAIYPDDVDTVHIVNGILQVTPDIEEEIEEVERGETVSMSEFKTMFARWL